VLLCCCEGAAGELLPVKEHAGNATESRSVRQDLLLPYIGSAAISEHWLLTLIHC